MTKAIQITNTKAQIAFASIIVAAGLMLASPAFADTSVQVGVDAHAGWGGGFMMHRVPGVVGTVTAVSGTTLTVASKGEARPDKDADTNASAQTYTVDASNATVYKAGATSSVSAIAVNDNVRVQGTVNGTTVAATAIHDGIAGKGMWPGGAKNPALASIHGNGEPVIGGTISAVNGSTITISTSAGTTYTVNAANATVVKQGASSTVANLSQNDRVIIQGTVNGNSVTASSIIDSGVAPVAGTSTRPYGGRGFFGFLGGLFHSLFGFF